MEPDTTLMDVGFDPVAGLPRCFRLRLRGCRSRTPGAKTRLMIQSQGPDEGIHQNPKHYQFRHRTFNFQPRGFFQPSIHQRDFFGLSRSLGVSPLPRVPQEAASANHVTDAYHC